MKLHRTLRSALQPALETNDEQSPAERKAGDRDAEIEEHHNVVTSLTHGSDGELFSGEHELEAAAGEQERRDGLRWRPRG